LRFFLVEGVSMEGDTFKSRVERLAQKSRKALRLYTSMGQKGVASAGVYAEWQVQQWQEVNGELVRSLSAVLARPHQRLMVSDVFSLADSYYGQVRYSEAELDSSHSELIAAAASGDFIKAAKLSADLVSLKARVQATQAVYHELSELIQKSKISRPAEQTTTQLEWISRAVGGDLVDSEPGVEEDTVADSANEAIEAAGLGDRPAKVIELRRRSVS
jgi:hypothetical protein